MVPFSLPTRKGNNERKNNQNSVLKIQDEKVFLFKGPKTRDAQRGFTPPLWRPGCDGVVYPGIRYTDATEDCMCPRPQRGQGWSKGSGGPGAFNTTRN